MINEFIGASEEGKNDGPIDRCIAQKLVQLVTAQKKGVVQEKKNLVTNSATQYNKSILHSSGVGKEGGGGGRKNVVLTQIDGFALSLKNIIYYIYIRYFSLLH